MLIGTTVTAIDPLTDKAYDGIVLNTTGDIVKVWHFNGNLVLFVHRDDVTIREI